MTVSTGAFALDRLLKGEMTVSGRLIDASNTTLLASIDDGDGPFECIYKPTVGERPLWDFDSGTLAHREVATYLLASRSGLTFVPPTVFREDAPLGGGMVQRWLPDGDYETLVRITDGKDLASNYLPVIHARDSAGDDVVVEHLDDPGLQNLCLFDLIVNNADRKGGHLLVSEEQTFGVDHGLTWHTQPKIRTILWGWAGLAFSARHQDLISCLIGTLSDEQIFSPHVTPQELVAAQTRAKDLLALGCFPHPQADEPSIPWPVF